MIEILILIFLARDLGKLARQKGLRPSTWQIYLVAGWIFAEIIGAVFALLIFGMDNLITVMLIALGFAFASYFILRARLEKYPDSLEDDIDNFGN